MAGQLAAPGAMLWNLCGPAGTIVWSAAGVAHVPDSDLGRRRDGVGLELAGRIDHQVT